jgi:hypothetical protein
MPSSADEKAQVSVNRAGWRVLAGVALALTLAAIVALLAQDGLFDKQSHVRPDGLTTLALLLAILAFVVQIGVFAFQTVSNTRAVQRTEELNHQASLTLGKIEVTSDATQQFLVSQFNKLLDYVVGPQPTAASAPQHDDPLGEDGSVVGEAEDEEVDREADRREEDQPATASDVRAIVGEVLASRTARPVFDLPHPKVNPVSDSVIRELTSWPNRKEAEQSVAVLKSLSTLGVVNLFLHKLREVDARTEGRPVGLRTPANPLPQSQELIDAGLTEREGPIVRLTERGRRVARTLPGYRASEKKPSWYTEVLAPLSKRPTQP